MHRVGFRHVDVQLVVLAFLVVVQQEGGHLVRGEDIRDDVRFGAAFEGAADGVAFGGAVVVRNFGEVDDDDLVGRQWDPAGAAEGRQGIPNGVGDDLAVVGQRIAFGEYDEAVGPAVETEDGVLYG